MISTHPVPSETVVFSPSATDDWRLADAFEGTMIFGGTGSGKTTGSGKALAEGFLKAGLGGLVLTVKTDEAKRWIDYALAAGREADIQIVEPKGPYRFNFLEYEAERQGPGAGLTYDLVNVLTTSMDGGAERRQASDPYWDDAVRQLLTNAIDLAATGTERVGLDTVLSIISSAPQSDRHVKEFRDSSLEKPEGWAKSACAQALLKAGGNSLDEERKSDVTETWKYFLYEFARYSGRLRSSILSSFMSRLTGLERSPFKRLFGSDTTFTPEDTFGGKITILNIPIKEYGEVGRMAQSLYKTSWQRAVERRGNKGNPVFLWADEAQYFINRGDMSFFQTARSARACTVYLTQSIANIRAALDGKSSSAPYVSDSLLGAMQTKIFHSNACPDTNEYAERVFGRSLKTLRSATRGQGVGLTEAYLPEVEARLFSTLKKGGIVNDGIVQAYMFQSGRTWNEPNGTNWLRAEFRQFS